VAITIRPPDPADLAALTGFFAGLSMRTRVQRFFAPIRPTPALVRRACGQSGQSGPAGPADGPDVLVATHGGVIVGHAMAADRAAAGESLTEIGVLLADTEPGQATGPARVRPLLSPPPARAAPPRSAWTCWRVTNRRSR
jgi:hypothetical protein